MALKFYTSVAKELKLKVRRFYGLIPMFVEVAVEKLVQGTFYLPPHYAFGLYASEYFYSPKSFAHRCDEMKQGYD